MNTPRLPVTGLSPSPSSRDALDWSAQEHALSSATDDHRDALLSRALRSMPLAQPPAGFAVEMARIAATHAPAHAPAHAATTRDDGRVEGLLQQVLLALLVLAALAVVAVYGGQWLAMAEQAFGAAAVLWTLACAACAGVSWSLGWMRRWIEMRALPLAG